MDKLDRLLYHLEDWQEDIGDWLHWRLPHLCLRRGGGRIWGISIGSYRLGNLFLTWYNLRAERWAFEICFINRYNQRSWALSYPKFVPYPPDPPPVMHKVLSVRLRDGMMHERWIGLTPLQSLGNPQARSNMNIDKDYLASIGYTDAVLNDPPPGVLDRLTKAFALADKEGRGKATLDDFNLQFFVIPVPFRGKQDQQMCCIQSKATQKIYVDGVDEWMPAGNDPVGKALYDCRAVVDEVLKLIK